jgi:hypothetical protein
MTDLEKKILNTITTQKLAPKPAYVFLAKRSVFWTLAIAAVVLGGISTAVLGFVAEDYFTTGWRILDNIRFHEALLVLPLLWLVLIGFFTASAVFGLRQTRRGYRFKASNVAVVAVVASLSIGLFMHYFDVGRALHTMLRERFPAYEAFTYVPFPEWSRPDEGYLGGTVLSDVGGKKIKLLDFRNEEWIIDVQDARIEIDSPLLEEGDIAIEGTRTGDHAFKASRITAFD